jgi:hypothetical protein
VPKLARHGRARRQSVAHCTTVAWRSRNALRTTAVPRQIVRVTRCKGRSGTFDSSRTRSGARRTETASGAHTQVDDTRRSDMGT